MPILKCSCGSKEFVQKAQVYLTLDENTNILGVEDTQEAAPEIVFCKKCESVVHRPPPGS